MLVERLGQNLPVGELDGKAESLRKRQEAVPGLLNPHVRHDDMVRLPGLDSGRGVRRCASLCCLRCLRALTCSPFPDLLPVRSTPRVHSLTCDCEYGACLQADRETERDRQDWQSAR